MNFKMYCENNDGEHKYSCTMALVENNKNFLKFAKKIAKEDLEECGIEKNTHATILFGTHTDNVHEIKALLLDSGIKEITMNLKGLSVFPAGKDGVPLKVDVESKELKTLNKLLKTLPNTNDYPTYKAHITIAYLKEEAANKYLEIDPFKGKELATSKIMFSKTDGIKIFFDLNEL